MLILFLKFATLGRLSNIFGSIGYTRSIVYKRQNFLKVVVHVIIIDQCIQTTRFSLARVICGKAKFCLRMVRWFFSGFSGFRPPSMNDRLDISEIFLKGP